jgi:cell division protease FtsH
VAPGGDGDPTAHFSEETAKLLDEEVRRIVGECHEEAVRVLKENRPRLDHLAEAVLKHDTLDEDEIYAAAGVPKPPDRSAPLIAPPLPPNGSRRDEGAPGEVAAEAPVAPVRS